MTDRQVVVVGGGVMGAATAWLLARRGADVLLLERFGPAHDRGSSHGAMRNFNTSYAAEPYVAMLVEARRLYGELGAGLIEPVGLVRHGGSPVYPDVVAALASVGQAAEVLPAAEAQARWPQIRVDREALWIPEAGRVRAEDAWRAMLAGVEAEGGEVRFGTAVTGVRVLGDDEVEVATAEGCTTARRAVVTVGGWTAKLLGDAVPLPELRVTQEQPAHFRPLDPGLEWPTFMHDLDRSRHDGWLSGIYGMRTAGEGIKAGWHGTGPVVDPDHRDRAPVPAQLAALQAYARAWLPGVDADAADPISCTYTTTPTEDFVLDRVGPVVVGAGFSGHGFKFAPAVGRILADLATDDAAVPPAAFRLPAARRRLVV
ncbi:FAD-dependent oxidoreductase [Amnibacterium endophyticum]|uniref:FAD-dependent oxidoreductase n=1 Tax=Amnibacterium endophyticum TaxID=2109337 RepID=A0ABW4LF48_9MICO